MAFRGLSTVASLTLASRVMGLARDAGMAVLFGAGPLMDAFTLAFRLPNLARRLFGEGSLTAAFLPAYVAARERDPAAARRLTWSVAAALAAVLTGLTLVAEAGLVAVAATGWGGPGAARLAGLTAILLPYVVWICVAAQLSAVLHAAGRFFAPAALPLVLNGVWLAALAVVPWLADEPEARMRWVAAAVSLSGVAQLAVAWAAAARVERGPRLRGAVEDWRASRGEVRAIAGAMLPTLVGLSVTQLNAVLDSLLAWLFAPAAGLPAAWHLVEDGTATALYLGQRMYQFPLGVFGVALGTVLFPVLARHAAAGDAAAMGRDLTRGLALSAAIGLPASAGLTLLARPATRLLFEHGEFDAGDTLITARVVAAYAAFVWALIGLLIVNRGFYAAGDAATPLRAGLAAVAVNGVLNAALLPTLGGVGLALASGVSAAAQLAWSARRVGGLDRASLRSATLRAAAATAVMAAVVVPAMRWELGRVGDVAVPLLAGAAAYAAAAWGMGLAGVLRDE